MSVTPKLESVKDDSMVQGKGSPKNTIRNRDTLLLDVGPIFTIRSETDKTATPLTESRVIFTVTSPVKVPNLSFLLPPLSSGNLVTHFLFHSFRQGRDTDKRDEILEDS